MSTEPPDDRCGFVPDVTPGRTASCCYRPTWRDHDSCIWHADVPGDQKPVEELQEARTPESIRNLGRGADTPHEILDGARLSGAQFPEGMDFEGVYLRDGDLSHAELRNANLARASVAFTDLADTNLRESTLENLDARRAQLPEADLRSTDLAGADLFDADLRGVHLLESNLDGADLRNVEADDAVARGASIDDALLDAASFEEADLREVSLSNARMVDARLTDSSLGGATLDGATLTDGDLRNADLQNASLEAANLSGATLERANLQQADLAGAELMAADLAGVNLLGADLSSAYLLEAELPDSHLVDATLEEANLQSATLDGSRMQHVDAAGASLRAADVRDTQLREAVLDDADLRDADLTDTSLASASLVATNLERAVLTQADLFDADFRRSRFYGAVFAEARINDGTTFGDRCVYDPKSAASTDGEADDVGPLAKAAGAYQGAGEALPRERPRRQAEPVLRPPPGHLPRPAPRGRPPTPGSRCAGSPDCRPLRREPVARRRHGGLYHRRGGPPVPGRRRRTGGRRVGAPLRPGSRGVGAGRPDEPVLQHAHLHDGVQRLPAARRRSRGGDRRDARRGYLDCPARVRVRAKGGAVTPTDDSNGIHHSRIVRPKTNTSSASRNAPRNASAPASARATGPAGLRSPYPTVVNETTLKYSASGSAPTPSVAYVATVSSDELNNPSVDGYRTVETRTTAIEMETTRWGRSP